MPEFIFAGDSWALKGYTSDNYSDLQDSTHQNELRLADYWPWEYQSCLCPGQGNLDILEKLTQLQLNEQLPIIWVFTEPGRDYGKITGNPEFNWMQTEEIFEIRDQLNKEIFKRIRASLGNPIAMIGGLSDVNVDYAQQNNIHILHPSWQKWIADLLDSKWFVHGWGASDIGWRMHYNNVIPSRAATFAWDEQIKEWCWWEECGYFFKEHPSPKANLEFAEYLQPQVEQWLTTINQIL